MLNGGSVMALRGLLQKRLNLLKALVLSVTGLLVLASCVAAPSEPSNSPSNDETSTAANDVATEVIIENPLKTRCEEIVAVAAYAFGIGTRDSTGPFGGGGRVRWKVDDSRYERDADLDTAGEGVICFRSGLIRQLENGTQQSIVDVREALEASEFGLESLAYIPLAELMSLATFLFTAQNGQEVIFDSEALLAQVRRSALDLTALETNYFESGQGLAESSASEVEEEIARNREAAAEYCIENAALASFKGPQRASIVEGDTSQRNRAGLGMEGPDTWLCSEEIRPGALCFLEGERKQPQNKQAVECRRMTLDLLRWVGVRSGVTNSTPYPLVVSEGDPCYNQGDRLQVNDETLECRYVSGMDLVFKSVSGSNDTVRDYSNLASVDICKMRDQRPRRGGGGSTAFPMQGSRMQTNGVVDVAILPFDFPDSPAPGKPIDLIEDALAMIDQRNLDLYGNRLQYRWHIPEDWYRLSLDAEYYNQDHQTVQPDGSRLSDGTKTLLTAAEQLTEMFSLAEKEIDIEAMDFFFLYTNPYDSAVQFGPGYFQDVTSDTTTYRAVASYPLGFWSFNGHFLYNGVPMFEWMSHEMSHFHGLVLHAPGNGTHWFYGSHTTWEAWVASWREDEEYACVDMTKTNNADFELDLSSFDLTSDGFKSVIIKVSGTQIVVVESRRKGLYNTAFPVGFAGITAYVVDATKAGDRWDGDASREKDYFAYFLRNNTGGYPISPGGPDLGDENVIAYEGDSFTYRGVNIELVQSGDFDTVRISTDSGILPASGKDKARIRNAQLLAREAEEQGFCGCCGCFPGAKLH